MDLQSFKVNFWEVIFMPLLQFRERLTCEEIENNSPKILIRI